MAEDETTDLLLFVPYSGFHGSISMAEPEKGQLVARSVCLQWDWRTLEEGWNAMRSKLEVYPLHYNSKIILRLYCLNSSDQAYNAQQILDQSVRVASIAPKFEVDFNAPLFMIPTLSLLLLFFLPSSLSWLVCLPCSSDSSPALALPLP